MLEGEEQNGHKTVVRMDAETLYLDYLTNLSENTLRLGRYWRFPTALTIRLEGRKKKRKGENKDWERKENYFRGRKRFVYFCASINGARIGWLLDQ